MLVGEWGGCSIDVLESFRYYVVRGANMKYRVVLIQSDEGFSVSCPALKGCHSQGSTREEALENIRDAIREWLDAEGDEKSVFTVIEDEVTV
jgi:predicted RNase H-like HicB family nuclease